MNISSEISNSSHYLFSNGTEAKADSDVFSVVYIICVLLSFPINSYVIWLIVTGTGNGLVAEFFNLNLSVCEILLCVETVVIFLTYEFHMLWTVVFFFDGVFVIGHPFFECLICVERYLAVVHPVTFLKYKPLRYKLMCSAVTWITTVVSGVFSVTLSFVLEVYVIFLIITFMFVLSIKLFCCVAVLRALKQSGPGERGRERKEENHMKRRAFYFILITTLCMLLIYSPYIIIIFVFTTENVNMFVCVAQFCFILAGLVQPALFLYRVGKLNFIKCQ